jgi:hypothetical protein
MKHAILLLSLVAAAAIAADDPGKRELEQSRRHHSALAEKDRDIEALTKALAKARADAEQCIDASRPKKAASAAREGGRLDE